jgi:hypothetical protein
MNFDFKKLQAIIYPAYAEKRYEFLFSLFQLLKVKAENEHTLKVIENLENEFLELSGYQQTASKKNELREYADETLNYYNLIAENDVAEFEKMAGLEYNTSERMKFVATYEPRTA